MPGAGGVRLGLPEAVPVGRSVPAGHSVPGGPRRGAVTQCHPTPPTAAAAPAGRGRLKLAPRSAGPGPGQSGHRAAGAGAGAAAGPWWAEPGRDRGDELRGGSEAAAGGGAEHGEPGEAAHLPHLPGDVHQARGHPALPAQPLPKMRQRRLPGLQPAVAVAGLQRGAVGRPVPVPVVPPRGGAGPARGVRAAAEPAGGEHHRHLQAGVGQAPARQGRAAPHVRGARGRADQHLLPALRGPHLLPLQGLRGAQGLRGRPAARRLPATEERAQRRHRHAGGGERPHPGHHHPDGGDLPHHRGEWPAAEAAPGAALRLAVQHPGGAEEGAAAEHRAGAGGQGAARAGPHPPVRRPPGDLLQAGGVGHPGHGGAPDGRVPAALQGAPEKDHRHVQGVDEQPPGARLREHGPLLHQRRLRGGDAEDHRLPDRAAGRGGGGRTRRWQRGRGRRGPAGQPGGARGCGGCGAEAEAGELSPWSALSRHRGQQRHPPARPRPCHPSASPSPAPAIPQTPELPLPDIKPCVRTSSPVWCVGWGGHRGCHPPPWLRAGSLGTLGAA